MKTVKVLVLEPGKGKAVNPYAPMDGMTAIDPRSKFWKFAEDNPQRPAIDLNGHDLQPREQAYGCKEWYQVKLLAYHNEWRAVKEGELQALKDLGREIRPCYQSVEDAVKGENSIDWPEDLAHENGNYKCKCGLCGRCFQGHKRRVRCKECSSNPINKASSSAKPKHTCWHVPETTPCEACEWEAERSTPVNEAKEVEKLWKDVYSAIAHALGYPGNNSDVKDITLATNNVMNVISATHPIENKSARDFYNEHIGSSFDRIGDDNSHTIISSLEAYKNQVGIENKEGVKD